MYGRITGLILSLGWPGFYRHVARNWGGIGLLYVILLMTITWIPLFVQAHLAISNVAEVEFPKVAKKFPDVALKNGKVSSPVPQPLEIKDDQTGRVVFVLDTTGQIKNLDQTKADFLVTETHLHQRDPNTGAIQVHDLAQLQAQLQFGDFEFNADWVQDFLRKVALWGPIIAFPFCLFVSIIRALVLMLLASLGGLIANSISGARVSYGGLLRLGAVGMTLSVYIDLALWLIGFGIPIVYFIGFFFVALLLTTSYVAFGCVVSIPPKVDVDYPAKDHLTEDDWQGRGDTPRAAPPSGYPRDDGGFKA